MDITILHNEQTFKARVVYNFKQVSDLIWVKFDKALPELDKDLMLTCCNGEWQPDAALKEKYPKIFEQVMTRLENTFSEAVRCAAEMNHTDNTII